MLSSITNRIRFGFGPNMALSIDRLRTSSVREGLDSTLVMLHRAIAPDCRAVFCTVKVRGVL